VTAEFAVALPAALACLALAIGAVQAAGQQVRLLDAAAVDARLLGRGDEPRGAGASGDVGRVVEREGDLVCVTLTARSAAVGLGAADLRVSARACALDEQVSGEG
jgi:hypothetical protein